MQTKSQNLEKLKHRIFKGNQSELNQVYNLCAVMEICGGYEQLLNLPIPTLKMIMKYLEFINKKTEKMGKR